MVDQSGKRGQAALRGKTEPQIGDVAPLILGPAYSLARKICAREFEAHKFRAT